MGALLTRIDNGRRWDGAGNILLTSGGTQNPHGFCAKVSDFGLARDMDLVSRVETKTTGGPLLSAEAEPAIKLVAGFHASLFTKLPVAAGTVTHMPPELLSDGIISKVCLDTMWLFPKEITRSLLQAPGWSLQQNMSGPIAAAVLSASLTVVFMPASCVWYHSSAGHARRPKL